MDFSPSLNSSPIFPNVPSNNLHTDDEPARPTAENTDFSILMGKLLPNGEDLIVVDRNNVLKLIRRRPHTNIQEKVLGNYQVHNQFVISKNGNEIALAEPGRIVYGALESILYESHDFVDTWFRDGEIAFSADENYLMVPVLENKENWMLKTLVGVATGTIVLGAIGSLSAVNPSTILLVGGVSISIPATIGAIKAFMHARQQQISAAATAAIAVKAIAELNNPTHTQRTAEQPSQLVIKYLPLKSNASLMKDISTKGKVTFVGFSGDKSQVIVVEDNKRVTVSSLYTKARARTFSLEQNNNAGSSSTTKIISSIDANTLVAINADGEGNAAGYRVQIYTLKNRGYELTSRAHFPLAFSFSLSPNKLLLAAISTQQHKLYLLSTNLQPLSNVIDAKPSDLPRLTGIHTISWTAESKLMTVKEDNYAPDIWDIEMRGNEFLYLPHDPPPSYEASQHLFMVA